MTGFTPDFVLADIIDYKWRYITKYYPLPVFEVIPGDCGATYQIELQYVPNGVPEALPAFMTFDDTVPEFSADLNHA